MKNLYRVYSISNLKSKPNLEKEFNNKKRAITYANNILKSYKESKDHWALAIVKVEYDRLEGFKDDTCEWVVWVKRV